MHYKLPFWGFCSLHRNQCRHGMTLTEVLVCLAVLAVLLGLLLPAVQAARSSMARLSCLNNLRQLGIATQAYEQAHGQIPRSICAGNVFPRRNTCFSAQAHLLPYLEADALARGIDWADEEMDDPGVPPRTNAANASLLTRRVAVFLCPADPNGRDGANSYRQSLGWSVLVGGNDPLPTRLAGFGDGLSNTALFSERQVAGSPPAQRRNPLIVMCPPHEIGPCCVQAQLGSSGEQPGDPYAGATWLRGGDRHARYAHLFPPNSRLRDCEVGGWVGLGLMTARSNHPGGVNLLFADGHVQFVQDAIDLKVWRAWGTPNGGEALP